MINNKSILAIIPARGGSKGIKEKNLSKILEKTLISYVSMIINELDMIDHAVVSTDHEAIKNEAISHGLDAPFIRPQELSGDFISDYQVLIHALEESEQFYKKTFDIILMLQPTSPLRTEKHVIQCIDKLINENYESICTVTPVPLKYHALKQLSINKEVLSIHCASGENIISRQQLSSTYYRNGACYAFTRKCLKEEKSIFSKKRAGALIIHDQLISIDTYEDLEETERIIKSKK